MESGSNKKESLRMAKSLLLRSGENPIDPEVIRQRCQRISSSKFSRRKSLELPDHGSKVPQINPTKATLKV